MAFEILLSSYSFLFFCRVRRHLFGAEEGTGTAADERDCTAPTQTKRSFPAVGWTKLIDRKDLTFDFSVVNIMQYFVARKEGDGLPADNFRSVSSHSFKLYTKAYCRDVEVALGADDKELFLQCFCKVEMKVSERYRIEASKPSFVANLQRAAWNIWGHHLRHPSMEGWHWPGLLQTRCSSVRWTGGLRTPWGVHWSNCMHITAAKVECSNSKAPRVGNGLFPAPVWAAVCIEVRAERF